MSESMLVREILLAYGMHPTIRLFRNTTGFFKDGNRGIHYGLCVGSSDIIGWAEWDGDCHDPACHAHSCARFVALECKVKPRKATPEQTAFILAVDRAGGIAGVVFSLQDVAALLGPPTSSRA